MRAPSQFRAVALSGIITALALATADAAPAASGALSVLPSNPYYFQDAHGEPVLLVGDYTWGTFSDLNYDYVRFFDSLHARGLNIARIWLWWGCEEITTDPIPARHIEPYMRPGPGIANDGRPKYDLTRFNPAFFERLRTFCRAARQRGIQLQLIAMDAWMIKHAELWKLHAFQRDNNVNGVDGDPAQTGEGTDGQRGFCSLGNPEALAYQKALVRKIVETTNRFDNVHYEIANENYYSADWELALCDYIKEIERAMPRQHLTMRRDLPLHSDVVQRWDPAIVRRGMLERRSLGQPLIFDTDWTINENDDEVRAAMWTALVSGGHFAYMDDSLEFRLGKPLADKRAQLHKQIDYAAAFMRNVKPWEMTPDDALVRSGTAYAMASEVRARRVPATAAAACALDLSGMRGPLRARWYDPRSGQFTPAGAVTSSAAAVSRPPILWTGRYSSTRPDGSPKRLANAPMRACCLVPASRGLPLGMGLPDARIRTTPATSSRPPPTRRSRSPVTATSRRPRAGSTSERRSHSNAANGMHYARVWHWLPWEGGNALWPWRRLSTPQAGMGGGRYDLDTWDPEYWRRIRDGIARCAKARHLRGSDAVRGLWDERRDPRDGGTTRGLPTTTSTGSSCPPARLRVSGHSTSSPRSRSCASTRNATCAR